MSENEFFIHVSDTNKRLFVSRPKSIKGKALSQSCLDANEVEYEMSQEKHREILEICGMTQEGLEYFVKHYGKTYRYLNFFHCQTIKDFSPLEDMKNLESVNIDWNNKAESLWDLSRNPKLKRIGISDAKKLTYKLNLLNTSKTLEKIFIRGDIFNSTPMESLNSLAGISTLKTLQLYCVKAENHDVSFLKTLPNLEIFNFPAGMFTTEEIAKMVAYYPNLKGSSLCAYNKEDAILNDVRICGYRKPSLDLPKDQKRLDKYILQFEALVEKYKSEIR